MKYSFKIDICELSNDLENLLDSKIHESTGKYFEPKLIIILKILCGGFTDGLQSSIKELCILSKI